QNKLLDDPQALRIVGLVYVLGDLSHDVLRPAALRPLLQGLLVLFRKLAVYPTLRCVCVGADVEDDVLSKTVDISHQADLVVSFVGIGLVDADAVHPDPLDASATGTSWQPSGGLFCAPPLMATERVEKEKRIGS